MFTNVSDELEVQNLCALFGGIWSIYLHWNYNDTYYEYDHDHENLKSHMIMNYFSSLKPKKAEL
jgi:hypothetical protein